MIKVITAANAAYRDNLQRLQQSLHSSVALNVYNLGDLGHGIPWPHDPSDFEHDPQWVLKCSFKPALLLHALKVERDSKFLMWMDADCEARFTERDIAAMGKERWDWAVTVKTREEILHSARKRSHCFSTINAGVIIFRVKTCRRMLEDWNVATRICGGFDQPALGFISGNPTQRKGCVQRPQGIVKLLKTEKWNCYYLGKECASTAKVIHYKGGRVAYIPE